MSSPDRRLVLLSLAALAGCGFTPALAPGGDAAGLFGQIEVDAPTDREGFLLVQRLEERLGRPDAPRYRLLASIRLSEDGVAITGDQVTTRFTVLGEVDFQLVELATDKVVTAGTVDSFTAYSTTGTTVASLAAQRDARARLMVILADEIVARLIATAGTWRT